MSKEVLNIDKENNEVLLSLSHYEELVRDSRWLGYLSAAGVDNWQGMDYAIELAHEGGYFAEEVV